MFQPKLIIFDLNKTLITENSWYDLNAALGVRAEEDAMLMKWGSEGIVTDQQGQDILCAIYRVRARPTRDEIVRILTQYTYTLSARECVSTLQSRGYVLALVSGAMDLLVQHVAAELSIDHFASNNTFEFDEQGVLSRIHTDDNDVTYKAVQLQKLCDQLHIEPDECMVVGDGDNDMRLFELTGHGVTFTGSKIADTAEHVVGSLRELPNLVA